MCLPPAQQLAASPRAAAAAAASCHCHHPHDPHHSRHPLECRHLHRCTCTAQVARLCDERVFLRASAGACLARRWRRDGVRRPDRWCDDGAARAPDEPTAPFRAWFEQVVWEAHEAHLPAQRAHGAPWLELDADGTPADVVAREVCALPGLQRLGAPAEPPCATSTEHSVAEYRQ